MTPNQQRFVQEYMIDLNATQAAIRAGYSKHTAGQIGVENLRKPIIATAISELQAQEAKKYEVTRESLAREYDEAFTLAKSNAQPAAMVSATSGKAKLFGMADDKAPSATAVSFVTVYERSPED